MSNFMAHFGLLRLIIIVFNVTFVTPSVARGQGLEALQYKNDGGVQNEVRAVKTELLVEKTEKKAIAQAKKLIQKYKGQLIEADLQLRLAELYMRRAKTEKFFELNRTSDVAISVAPKRVKKASSKKMVNKAISTYYYIQNKFPKYEKIDIVTFNNAFANQQLDKNSQAKKLYWKVINKYSYSFLVPDSYLAVGEMAFNEKNFKQALNHFNAIKTYPNSQVYPYGLYKAAWSHYNLQDTPSGLKQLEAVVDYGKKVEKEGLNARLDLRGEALRDMVLFFSEVLPAKKAYSYFSKQAKKEEMASLINRLSHLYKRHSKYGERYTIIKDFISEQGQAAEVAGFYNDIVNNFESAKNREQAVKYLAQFHKVCDKDSSWSKNQLSLEKGQASKDCYKQLHGTSIKLARKWLKIWNRKKSDIAMADFTEKAFRSYLKDNKSYKKAGEARFALAQLLYKRGKYRLASEEYELVAISKVGLSKNIIHDAAYGSLVSLEKDVKDKWNNKDHKKYKELTKLYSSQFPKGKHYLAVNFKLGLISYEKKDFADAAPIFKVLGERYLSHKKGMKSQDLYLDILNSKEKYSDLKAYSKKLLAKKISKKRKAYLQKIYQQAYFLEIQNSKANELETAESYMAFYKENKSSDLSEKALWNAIQLYTKNSEPLKAAQVSEVYFSKYPTSKKGKEALLKAATSYESLAQLGKAAKSLEKLARIDKESRLKWKSLAADFYFYNSDYKKAEGLYRSLLKSPAQKISFHALQQLKKVSKKGSKSYWKYNQAIINSGQQPQAGEAQLEVVDLLFKQKNYSKAFTEARKVLAMKTASKESRASARFIQASILENEYKRQSLKSRLDKFALVLSLKTEKMEKAQQAYQSVIRYGDAEKGIQAMLQLARLYMDFVSSVNKMPPPKGLGANDIPAFRQQMSQLTIPLEEKGVETLDLALKKARSLGLGNQLVSEIQFELDRFNLQPTSTAYNKEIELPKMAVPKMEGAGS